MDNKDNKYDIVLDIIENPRKYSSSQLNEILSDPETRDIYNLLCKTDSAIETDKTVNVDAEWEKFSRKHSVRRRSAFMWKGSRAASIAIIVCTSLVAIAAGIAITVGVYEKTPESSGEEVSDATNRSSTIYHAAPIEHKDSITGITAPIMFEDDTLEEIMKVISSAYGVNVTFHNNKTADLHLYYRLDTALPLDEIISQLNTFEQINIKRDDQSLIIE